MAVQLVALLDCVRVAEMVAQMAANLESSMVSQMAVETVVLKEIRKAEEMVESSETNLVEVVVAAKVDWTVCSLAER